MGRQLSATAIARTQQHCIYAMHAGLGSTGRPKFRSRPGQHHRLQRTKLNGGPRSAGGAFACPGYWQRPCTRRMPQPCRRSTWPCSRRSTDLPGAPLKTVVRRIGPVKSRYIRLAENRLRQRPQKHSSRSDLRTSTTARSGPARIHPTLLCRRYLKVQLGGVQGGGLLGRGCSSAAWARPPSPPCMQMRRTRGLLEPSRERAIPPGAVASQVASRFGRAGLPRPPSLPGSRLHS